MDEHAALVHRAGPVGVAIEEQAEVVATGRDALEGLVDVRPDGLGVDAAEERVALLVDLRDPDPAASEQPGEPAGAGAVHRLDEDRQVGRLEGVEVDRPAQEALIAGIRIEALDEAGRLRLREGPPGDGRAAIGSDGRLEHGEDLRTGRRSRG